MNLCILILSNSKEKYLQSKKVILFILIFSFTLIEDSNSKIHKINFLISKCIPSLTIYSSFDSHSPSYFSHIYMTHEVKISAFILIPKYLSSNIILIILKYYFSFFNLNFIIIRPYIY